jgi:hypothetical protein
MLRVGPEGSGGGGGGTISDIVGGTGIGVTDGTGPTTTITNTGVTSLVAGPGVEVSAPTGAVTVSTGPGMSNLLYVSLNGSDATGTGSFTLPYATYGKAAATAVTDGAAETNTYAVMFAPGTYAENVLLVPNVDLCGINDDAANSVYLNGNMGLLAADWAGATAFQANVSNVRLGNTADFNFLAAGSTGASFVGLYNCYIGGGLSGEGTSAQDVYFIDCEVHASAVVASDINLITVATAWYGGANSLTITAPTFGAGWFSYSTSLRCPVSITAPVNGVAATATLTGTSINSTLTLSGLSATYTSTIDGVPALGVVLAGGAAIAQYTILGELPSQNVQPSTVNGQFLGTVGGVTTWATVTVGSFAGGTPGQVLLTNGTSAATWTTLGGDIAATSATGAVRIGSLQGGTIFITNNAGNFVWWPGASNPQISQGANASTSAGSGIAGELMSLTAQAGQNATGAGNNGGAGGNLALASGVGGTSGSATAGAAGEIDFEVGALTVMSLGAAGVGLLFSSVSQAITVGSIVLSPALYLHPVLVLTGAIAAARTVTFPNLPGLWLVDISGIGGISGTNTLTFASGTATTTPITSLTTNSNLLWVKTTGANGIQINL